MSQTFIQIDFEPSLLLTRAAAEHEETWRQEGFDNLISVEKGEFKPPFIWTKETDGALLGSIAVGNNFAGYSETSLVYENYEDFLMRAKDLLFPLWEEAAKRIGVLGIATGYVDVFTEETVEHLCLPIGPLTVETGDTIKIFVVRHQNEEELLMAAETTTVNDAWGLLLTMRWKGNSPSQQGSFGRK